MIVWRSVHRRSPIPPMITSSINAKMKPSCTIVKSHTPSVPGIITHTETVSYRSRIIVRSVPGIVIKTGSINHGASINITTHISRCITDINILRCRFIYVYIFHIVHRHRSRNLFGSDRPCRGNLPGSFRTGRLIPDSFVDAIISFVRKQTVELVFAAY